MDAFRRRAFWRGIAFVSGSSSGFSVDPAAVVPEGMGSSACEGNDFFVDVLNFLGALFDQKSPRPHPVQSNALGSPEQQSTFLLGSWTSLRTNGRNWTPGKTFFRVFGPYDTDDEVETSEVREALKDFEFVGQEKMGDYMVSLFPSPSIRGVFVEGPCPRSPPLVPWVSAWAPSFC